MVDPKKMSDPTQHQTSKSGAVPQAADFSLAAEEVMAAVRELHANGGLADVFGRLTDEPDSTPVTT